MTNALRLAPPRVANGASVGVITPRGISRRKILGATTWLVRRIQVVITQRYTWGRAAKWTRFAPTTAGG